jgi:hypothetical protein
VEEMGGDATVTNDAERGRVRHADSTRMIDSVSERLSTHQE